MANIVCLLAVNLLLLYNVNAGVPHHGPYSGGYSGYFYNPPQVPVPFCEPRVPVDVDCVDDPLDSSCKIAATNENGTCVKEADCPTSGRILNYSTPPICGYDGETRLLCCPPPEDAEDENRRGGRPRPTNEGNTIRDMPVPQGGGPTSEEMCRRFYEGAPRAKRDTPDFSSERLKRDNYPFEFNPHHINDFGADQYLPPTTPPPKRTCIKTPTTTTTSTTTTTTKPPPTVETEPPGRTQVSPAFATPTEPGDYPYMAAIGYPDGDGVLKFLCGGFLADSCYVVTAAHCLEGTDPTHVRLGGVSLRDKTIQTTDLPIDPNGITPHPNFNPLEQYNDIAVLRLATCAPTSIRPACLWTDRFVGFENLTALGYGQTDQSKEMSDDLLKVDLSLYENDVCQKVFGATMSNRRKRGIVDEHLCAGRPLADREAFYDTCEGDSGGPIGATRERLFSGIPVPYVMGVTQFGRGCGKTPAGVYARISSHLGWLESVMWRNMRPSQ